MTQLPQRYVDYLMRPYDDLLALHSSVKRRYPLTDAFLAVLDSPTLGESCVQYEARCAYLADRDRLRTDASVPSMFL